MRLHQGPKREGLLRSELGRGFYGDSCSTCHAVCMGVRMYTALQHAKAQLVHEAVLSTRAVCLAHMHAAAAAPVPRPHAAMTQCYSAPRSCCMLTRDGSPHSISSIT